MFWIVMALAVAIPAAWLAGDLHGEHVSYGSHSYAAASAPFAVPAKELTYNLATGRHEVADTGRHRPEREGTRWFSLGPQPEAGEIFAEGNLPATKLH